MWLEDPPALFRVTLPLLFVMTAGPAVFPLTKTAVAYRLYDAADSSVLPPVKVSVVRVTEYPAGTTVSEKPVLGVKADATRFAASVMVDDPAFAIVPQTMLAVLKVTLAPAARVMFLFPASVPLV